MARLKYGDIAEFTIDRVDKKGCGLGPLEEKTAAVDFVIPGEKVAGTFIGRKDGLQRFRVDTILSASPDRVAARCPHAGVCGGCAWQHVTYERQLELKRGLVNMALEDGGVPLRVDRINGSEETFRYRNRMDFCVGDHGEVGLKQRGRWNAYVDIDECHLLSEGADAVRTAFRAWMRENDIEPWNAYEQTGYLRYLVIREGVRTGQRMVLIVTAEGELPAKDDLLVRLSDLATSVLHGVNPLVTDVSIPERIVPLKGEPWLEETVAGITYRIPPASFFQTNTVMAERLLESVRAKVEAARPATLLDLYCGVGFFGIGCAAHADRVVGYEIDEAAAVVATGNAERNGIMNAEFHAGKAEALLWDDARPDMVIIDPPRAGLHPKVVDTLLERRPERIVYVSCNYLTFARDWKRFSEAYALDALEAYDLFPHTAHVELIGMLRLK
jgi:23S rRNA (uracil1939-C5)-methyltransferase